MKKQVKKYVFSFFLIVTFVVVSVFNVYLIIDRNSSDMILLFAVACFFFSLWLLDFIFKRRVFRLLYKIFLKPMSRSMTMDTLGTSIVCEEEAYRTFKKMMKTLPSVYLTILIIGIVILLLS